MIPPLRAAAFDYDLPEALIAQRPLPERGASRLLVVERRRGGIAHRTFDELVDLIAPQDVLVLNTSRVMRARLRGRRASGAPAELLLLRPEPDGTWLALAHPGGKLKPGRRVHFGPEAEALIVEVLGQGLRRIQWTGALGAYEVMARHGEVPLPPYIRRAAEPLDAERYQTVYAEREGSAAAPTAGLHFTTELLRALEDRGMAVARLELHVGPGTFKPVQTERVEDHVMDEEAFALPDAGARLINARRSAGGACWAVGTTAVRALETQARPDGTVAAGAGTTRLFIYPPFHFRIVDRLITNFHLPRSTLLMLVAAFGGYDLVRQAYREAVDARYRFYSYGDAMAIL